MATRVLKTIKHTVEIIPPNPSFHNANSSPASPAPQTINTIIVYVSNPVPGLPECSKFSPIAKKQNKCDHKSS